MGVLTPMVVLSQLDASNAVVQATTGIKDVDAAFVTASQRNGTALSMVIPNYETSNQATVDVVKDVKDAVKDTQGVVGVAALGQARLTF